MKTRLVRLFQQLNRIGPVAGRFPDGMRCSGNLRSPPLACREPLSRHRQGRFDRDGFERRGGVLVVPRGSMGGRHGRAPALAQRGPKGAIPAGRTDEADRWDSPPGSSLRTVRRTSRNPSVIIPVRQWAYLPLSQLLSGDVWSRRDRRLPESPSNEAQANCPTTTRSSVRPDLPERLGPAIRPACVSSEKVG